MSGVEGPVPLDAESREGQQVAHAGRAYKTVREGKAYILVPEEAVKEAANNGTADGKPTPNISRTDVFYNPIQQFNRDLSVLAIRAFGEGLIAERRARFDATGGIEGMGKRARRARKRKAAGAVEGEGGAEEARKRPREEEEAADRQQDCGELEGGGVALPPSENTPAATTATLPHQRPIRILDALSATGLRALRYAQELPFRTAVTANDMSPAATAAIALNVTHNRVGDRVTPITGNALAHMYSVLNPSPPTAADTTASPSAPPPPPPQKYDVIDLDPYGTAVPFLDAAMHALAADGGPGHSGALLCVTCTDAGVFNSTGYPEKAFALYGGLPLRGPHAHEAGLRLILHAVSAAGARQGLHAEPLLSLSVDFYARVFVRVRRSAADVKFAAARAMAVFQCDAGCSAWETQALGRAQMREGKAEKSERRRRKREEREGREVEVKAEDGEEGEEVKREAEKPWEAGPGDKKTVETSWKYSMPQAPAAAPHCQHCGKKTHVSTPPNPYNLTRLPPSPVPQKSPPTLHGDD